MVLGLLSDKISATHPAIIIAVPAAKHVLVIVVSTPLLVIGSLTSANQPPQNTAFSHNFSSLFSAIIFTGSSVSHNSDKCIGSSSCDNSALPFSSNPGIKIKLYILTIDSIPLQ